MLQYFLVIFVKFIAWIEGTAIFLAVFIVAFVGSYNDYKKEEQFMKLHSISDKDNVVLNNYLFLI